MASQPWLLQNEVATLHIEGLTGELRTAHLATGISAFTWNHLPFSGHLLGVTVQTTATKSDPTEAPSLGDNRCHSAFVRGADFIATLTPNSGQSDQQPFLSQVYWRAVAQEDSMILLDTIISVHTEQLESMPLINICTQLESDEVWLLDVKEGEKYSTDLLTSLHMPKTIAQRPVCAVMRGLANDWSYAEMTHPEDLGICQIQLTKSGCPIVQRQFGGQMLEKGVIRRIRIRGVFLPRNHDLELAARCFASMAAESPPLTT